MRTADRIAALEMTLARVSPDDYLIMADKNLIYGVDQAGRHRFLHLGNLYETGTVVALPLRLARRTCEWLGGQPVSYRTWLEVEIKRLKGIL